MDPNFSIVQKKSFFSFFKPKTKKESRTEQLVKQANTIATNILGLDSKNNTNLARLASGEVQATVDLKQFVNTKFAENETIAYIAVIQNKKDTKWKGVWGFLHQKGIKKALHNLDRAKYPLELITSNVNKNNILNQIQTALNKGEAKKSIFDQIESNDDSMENYMDKVKICRNLITDELTRHDNLKLAQNDKIKVEEQLKKFDATLLEVVASKGVQTKDLIGLLPAELSISADRAEFPENTNRKDLDDFINYFGKFHGDHTEEQKQSYLAEAAKCLKRAFNIT